MSESSPITPIESLVKKVEPVFDLEKLAVPLEGRKQRVVKLFAALEKMKAEGRIADQDYEALFVDAAKALVEEMISLKGEVGDLAKKNVLAEVDKRFKAKDISTISQFKKTDPEITAEIARQTLDEIARWATGVIDAYTKKEEEGDESAKPVETDLKGVREEFLKELVQAESQSKYGVSHEHNEIDHVHKEFKEKLEHLKRSFPGEDAIHKELKEAMEVAIYKIYRRVLLESMGRDEVEEKTISNWDSTYRPEMLDKAHNIAESFSGVKISSVSELERKYKQQVQIYEKLIQEAELTGAAIEEPEEYGPEQILAEIEESQGVKLAPDQKVVVLDYLNLMTEFTARKFAHLSWMELKNPIVGFTQGEFPKRNYMPVDKDNNFTIAYFREYLFKQGLERRELADGKELGEHSKISLGDKSVQVLGVKEADNASGFELINSRERGELNLEQTIYGASWRALDRWAEGKLSAVTYVVDADGTRREKIINYAPGVNTANVHLNVDGLISGIKDYLSAQFYDQREKLDEQAVLRATRHWFIETYHLSSLAADSAGIPDEAYYQDRLYEYNEKYSEGRASWNVTMIKMLYTLREIFLSEEGGTRVLKQRFFNPLPLIVGEHEEIMAKKGLIRRMVEGRPFAKMKKALAEKGYLKGSSKPGVEDKRLEEEHVRHYNFLLAPYMEMDQKGQAQEWRHVVKDGKFVSKEYAYQPLNIETGEFSTKEEDYVYISQEDRAAGNIPEHYVPVYQSRMFTQMPIYATIFLKDANGRNQFYKTDREGEIGKPISLMDLQDENGEIVYEWFYKQEDAVEITDVISSKAKNGHQFLVNHLKSGEILNKLEDPKAVGALTNDIVYVMRHLPEYGNIIAAGGHKLPEVKDNPNHPWYKLDKKVQVQLIAMEVYVSIILRILDKRSAWGMDEVKDYLLKVSDIDSPPITPEMADAIYVAVEAGFGTTARTQSALEDITKKLKEKNVF